MWFLMSKDIQVHGFRLLFQLITSSHVLILSNLFCGASNLEKTCITCFENYLGMFTVSYTSQHFSLIIHKIYKYILTPLSLRGSDILGFHKFFLIHKFKFTIMINGKLKYIFITKGLVQMTLYILIKRSVFHNPQYHKFISKIVKSTYRSPCRRQTPRVPPPSSPPWRLQRLGQRRRRQERPRPARRPHRIRCW